MIYTFRFDMNSKRFGRPTGRFSPKVNRNMHIQSFIHGFAWVRKTFLNKLLLRPAPSFNQVQFSLNFYVRFVQKLINIDFNFSSCVVFTNTICGKIQDNIKLFIKIGLSSNVSHISQLIQISTIETMYFVYA